MLQLLFIKGVKHKGMKDLKISTQLILSNLAVVLLALIAIVFSILNIQSLGARIEDLKDKTVPLTTSTADVRRNIIIIERNLTEMVLTEDQNLIYELIEENNKSINEINSSMATIKANANGDNMSLVSQIESDLTEMESMRSGIQTALSDINGDWEESYNLLQNKYFTLSSSARQDLKTYAENITKKMNNDIYATQRRADIGLYIAVCLSVIFILFAIIRSIRLTRSINDPLHKIEYAAKALSEGNFDIEINYNRKNEFGNVCNSLEKSFVELKRIINELSDNLSELSNGNLTIEPSMTFPGKLSEIENSEVSLLEKLNDLFLNIKSVSEQINSGAAQVASGAQALAQGSTEQASSIEELSETLATVSNKVQINSENAEKANALATDSGVVAESALEDMRELVNSIKQISVTSENIGKIIKVIDDIAFQTNILALNAAVEAARAGTAGKGFAVVADEVRNLAQKSSDAAHETTRLIEDSINAVTNGEKIADKTSEAVSELVDKVKTVITTINDISKSSAEQANSINDISFGVEQISVVVQSNSATSQESAATSEELSSQVSVLNNMINQFKVRN